LREQLSRLQFIFLLMWVVMGTGYLTLPAAIAGFVGSDGWMVPLFFLLSCLVMAAVVALFLKSFPGKTLVEGLVDAFGRWLGVAAGLWVLLWFYLILCTIVREVVLFINVAVLTRFPSYVTAALMVVALGYAVSQGVEVLGRLAQLITPVVALITIILLALAQQHSNPGNLLPVLANGWTPVLRGSVPTTVYAMELAVALLGVPIVGKPRQIPRDLLLASLVLAIAGLLIELTVILVLGPSVSHLNFPILEVVRTIEYGDFLGRFDALYVMSVVVTIFLKLGFLHYGLVSETQRLFRLSNPRDFVWSASFAVWAGSVAIFPNQARVNEFILYSVFGYFGATVIILPLFAILVQRVRKWLDTPAPSV